MASTGQSSFPNMEPSCSCRCHVTYTWQSPQSLDMAIGQFLVQSVPRCDNKGCRDNSGARVTLAHIPPPWIHPFALMLIFKSRTGIRPSLLMSVSRVIPETHDVWNSITLNNLARLRHLFFTGEIGISNVDGSGRSLLQVFFSLHLRVNRSKVTRC